MARTLFLLIGAGLLVWVAVVVFSSFWVMAKTWETQQELATSKARALGLFFEDAQASLADAQESLDSAARFLPLVESIGWFPGIGDEILLIGGVIRSQRDITEALSPLYGLGVDIIRLSGLSSDYFKQVSEGRSRPVTFGDLPTQTKRAILGRLAGAAKDLDLLTARINLAQIELSRLLQGPAPGSLANALGSMSEELRRMGSGLELLRVVSHILPTFAGLQESSTNLMLLLNNNELRPGGGFIGTYGVLQAYGGDIQTLETQDVYALDNAARGVTSVPPTPLSAYNQTDKWFFRDANWSPDFALSAQKAVELFLSESASAEPSENVPTARRVDNVIAFTPTYAAALLAITGPITVGGQTFTKDNVADVLEYQVEFGYVGEGLPPTQRKQILADLVNEMKTHLYALPVSQWDSVSKATQRALREKQLILYSTNVDVQHTLVQARLGGAVASETADAIMVVDANLASLKSDPAVERTIAYAVKRDEAGKWVGSVDVTYVHTGVFDWKTTRYRTYTRLMEQASARKRSVGQ